MIFLTVGTQFPFDRLVKAVDEAVERELIKDKICAQIGKSHYEPKNFDYVEFLQKDQFEDYARNAACLISHAGLGIITIALEDVKPLLVMPRQRKYGEVVNDHQLAIAKRFEQLGHVLVAYEAEELPKKMEQLKTFVPLKRKTTPEAVTQRIALFLHSLATNPE